MPFSDYFTGSSTSSSSSSSSSSPRPRSPPATASLDEPHECSICFNTISVLSPENSQTESAYILPCSHIFGSICISRWLDIESVHQDCPVCRRRMVYLGCGHPLRPRDIRSAPRCVEKNEAWPEWCAGCRKESDKTKEAEERAEGRRYKISLKALEGMKVCLPAIWGGLSRGVERRVDGRIEVLTDDWRREMDVALGLATDGREEW